MGLKAKSKLITERTDQIMKQRGIIFGDDKTGHPGSGAGCSSEAKRQLIAEGILTKKDIKDIGKYIDKVLDRVRPSKWRPAMVELVEKQEPTLTQQSNHLVKNNGKNISGKWIWDIKKETMCKDLDKILDICEDSFWKLRQIPIEGE